MISICVSIIITQLKKLLYQTGEYILQDANKLSADLPVGSGSSKPHLSSFWEGRILQYTIDIHMMVILNSTECHLHDFIRLGNEMGLWFESVWDLGNIEYWGVGLTAGLSCKIKQLTPGYNLYYIR